LVLLFPAGLYLAQTMLAVLLARPAWYPGNPYDARALELRAAGAFFQQHHRADVASILAPEIGALGFTWEGDIIDAAGLSSTKVLQFISRTQPNKKRSAQAGVSRELFDEFTPDVLIGFELLVEDSLVTAPPSGWDFFAIEAFPEHCRVSIVGSRPFPFGRLIVLARSGTFQKSRYIAFRDSFFSEQLTTCTKKI
jgi:hypothetical protein